MKKSNHPIDLPSRFRTRKEKREFWLTIIVTIIIGSLIAITNFWK